MSKAPSRQIQLVKVNKHDKKQLWTAEFRECPGAAKPVTVLIRWGQEDGKFQEKVRRYEQGKVKRTPMRQAELEINKIVQDKIQKGYTHTESKSVEFKIPDNLPPQPMLALPAADYTHTLRSPVHVMPKLDGIFCIANLPTRKIYSRSRRPITGLAHVEESLSRVAPSDVDWIVGEIYLHGMTFQEISGIARRTKNINHAESAKLQFHVFDVMSKDPGFEHRYELLRKIVPPRDDVIKLVQCEKIEIPENASQTDLLRAIQQFHDRCLSDQYEGSMIHPSGDPGYQFGKRCKWLLKKKDFLQEEYECVRILPRNERTKSKAIEELAGSVLLKMPNGDTTFYATPKCSEPEKRELYKDREQYVGQMATVQFFSYTESTATSKGVPRFPVLLGFRHPDDM